MYSLEEVKTIFMNKGYVLLNKQYTGNKQYLIFEKEGFLFYNTLNGFIKTDNFKKWGKNNPYSIRNLRHYLRLKEVNVIIPEQEYDYNRLKVICKCGNEYVVSWDNFLIKKQYCCPSCGRQQSAKNHHKNKYEKLMEEKQLIPLFKYRGCKYNDYYITKEGYIVKTSLYNVLRGSNFLDTIFDVCNEYTINNIHTYINIHYPLTKFLSTEYNGVKSKYKFQCECGKQFETDLYNFIKGNKIRCDCCNHSLSSLARKTEEWLNENNIEFIKEKTFEGCVYKNLLRFDYYLIKLNKLLEIDGEQHEKPVCFGGCSIEEAIQHFEETKIKDDIKNQYCIKHNIPLLRIKYTYFDTEEYKSLLQTFTS